MKILQDARTMNRMVVIERLRIDRTPRLQCPRLKPPHVRTMVEVVHRARVDRRMLSFPYDVEWHLPCGLVVVVEVVPPC